MSCGVVTVRVADENGNLTEQPATDVAGKGLSRK